jgi:hypothetical protein
MIEAAGERVGESIGEQVFARSKLRDGLEIDLAWF